VPPSFINQPKERLMADAIVPVLCPNCGKENAVAIRDGETGSTIEHLCVGCSEKFSVKVDKMKKQAADVAKAAVKDEIQGIAARRSNRLPLAIQPRRPRRQAGCGRPDAVSRYALWATF
jgi:hypothetical protein